MSLSSRANELNKSINLLDNFEEQSIIKWDDWLVSSPNDLVEHQTTIKKHFNASKASVRGKYNIIPYIKKSEAVKLARMHNVKLAA